MTTFGFSAVSDFTHGVETLLDQLRSGQRQVSDELVGVLLASVDVIRDMLDAFQQGRNPDTDAIARCQADIDQQLSGECASAAPAARRRRRASRPATAPATGPATRSATPFGGCGGGGVNSQ